MTIAHLCSPLLLVAIVCCASDLPKSYRDAAALGAAQESAPATRGYFQSELLPYFGQKIGPVLKRCFATVEKPDDSSFSFVAVIDSEGRVVRVYKDHETNIFVCMADSLRKEVFPKPPVSPYYFRGDMDLRGDSSNPTDNSPDAPPLVLKPNSYSYTFGVPNGWEFNFEQAHTRGAALAFFPKGESFNESKSAIFVNEIDDGCAKHCMDVVLRRIAETIEDSRKQSPGAQATTASPVTTKDGSQALIRVLTGTKDPRDLKWDDKEALAFIGHDETIILVVLTARDPSTWEQDYAAFQRILAGHKFFNCDSPELRVPCKKE